MAASKQVDALTTIGGIAGNDYIPIFDTDEDILKKTTRDTLANNFANGVASIDGFSFNYLFTDNFGAEPPSGCWTLDNPWHLGPVNLHISCLDRNGISLTNLFNVIDPLLNIKVQSKDNPESYFYINGTTISQTWAGAWSIGFDAFTSSAARVFNSGDASYIAFGPTIDGALRASEIDHQNLTGAGINDHSTIDFHLSDQNNPHNVTKNQLDWTGTNYTDSYNVQSTTLENYTSETASSSYAGIDNSQGGTPYAQVSDLEALRNAYENLRISYDNLIQVVSALILELQNNNIIT